MGSISEVQSKSWSGISMSALLLVHELDREQSLGFLKELNKAV